jgi:hypothetical protein
LVVLVFLILSAASIIVETARLIHAWRTVNNVAQTAARYAVTLQYDNAYCPEISPGQHRCSTKDEADAARLISIRVLAYQTASGMMYDSTETVSRNQSTYFRVIVCGSHPGITWDDGSTSGAPPSCLPYEHPGDQGGPVIIYVEFNFPLITPLQALVGWMPLVAQRKMIVEKMGERIPGRPPTVGTPTPTPLFGLMPSP